MKSIIKSILLSFVQAAARLVGGIRPQRDEIVICTAPVPEGNRGDQALMNAVLETAQRLGYRKVHLVQTSYHPIESIKSTDEVLIHKKYDAVFSSPHCIREQLAFAWFLRGKAHCLLVGADVLDEAYSPARSAGSLLAMAIATAAGVPSRVIGFSVNGPPSETLRKILQRIAPRTPLYARDGFSYQRLVDAGIPNVKQVGDLAFLIQPQDPESMGDRDDLVGFIQEHAGPANTDLHNIERYDQSRLIGLNFTPGVMGEDAATRDRLFKKVIPTCIQLAEEQDLRFLLIPHDDQGGVEYLAELQSRLERSKPGISQIMAPMPSATQIKAVTGRLKHLFTCRLHLGIAGLGMGTAVTGFPYQGKFEGQFAYFDVLDCLFPADKLPADAKSFTRWMTQRIEASSDIASRVRTNLDSVLERSMINFEGLALNEGTTLADKQQEPRL